MRKALLILLASSSWAVAEPGAEVGAMFRKRCANCHTIPDPQLAPDRAWLDQIKRTT
ncbi:MAG: hypothetical protein ACYTGZ_11450 [Planctomycetota bacterium]|jgi:mono/diheme cytochrome c family protein